MTVPEKKQMNAGVELLLERMKTHPEEFTEQGKWVGIMQDIHKYAEKEESDTLNSALRSLMMQKVTERVLEGLVDPKDSNLKELLKAKLNATPLGGATPVRSSGLTLTTDGSGNHAWTNAVINTDSIINNQAQQVAQLRAMVEEYKAELTPKKHQTLYGRLKNYLHNDEKGNEVVEDSMGRKFINGVLQR